MSGHTPGPWSVSLGALVRVTAAGAKGGHYPVVICGVHRIGKHLGAERAGEVEANAHLLAAAPELLDALTLLRRLPAQVRVDLKAAHAEICKLQGLDPATHDWPEWSSPANTLRWLTQLECAADAAIAKAEAQQ